jgi:uncharacterized FlaG/YvyC family protein
VAARRAEQLQAEGRELNFRLDDLTGRLAIELLDAAGNVLREISPTEAVSVAEGAAV